LRTNISLAQPTKDEAKTSDITYTNVFNHMSCKLLGRLVA
jgi:hypothetical protein